jgi:hypothetical protein
MNQLQIDAEQTEAVERVAQFLVRFGMAMPAVLALESMRPLSVVGSQFMHVLSPSVTAFLPSGQWDALASLLEEREGLDRLIERIEQVGQGAE